MTGEINQLERLNTRCSEAAGHYDLASARAAGIRELLVEAALDCKRAMRFGRRTLYPIPLMSAAWMWLLRLLGRWHWSADMLTCVHELDLVAERLAKCLPVSVLNADGTFPSSPSLLAEAAAQQGVAAGGAARRR